MKKIFPEADQELFQIKEHTNLEYPVSIYPITISKLKNKQMQHWHEEMEISIVTEGNVEYIIDNNSFLLRTGDGIMVNQNILHTVRAVGEGDCTIHVLAFHPSFIFGYGETYMCAKYMTPVVTPPATQSIILKKDDPEAEKYYYLFHRLEEINEEKRYGYEIATKGALCQLWMYFLDFAVKLRSHLRETSLTSDEARAKHALLFIQNHFHENITLDAIAASIHVSKSECCRCIKRTLNMTPFEYLIKYRIFASTLIMMNAQSTELSISDVAASVGFNSTSYFNKWFRHFLGCTPTQYRRGLRTGESMENHQLMMDSFPESK